MNIIYIEKESMLNGDGNRCVVWCAGCAHHCAQCHNPETWDENTGHKISDEDLKTIDTILNNKYIKGVTFSGGDPLFPENRETIEGMMAYIKSEHPNKDIWMYTGYEWDEIKDLPLMQYVDVVVDGKYVAALSDINYPWAGSTNQKVIDVQSSLASGEICLHGKEKA